MAAERSLTLGTLFQARVDQSFYQATRTLRSVLIDLNRLMQQTGGGVNLMSSKFTNMGGTAGTAAAGTKKVKAGLKELEPQVKSTQTAFDRLYNTMRTAAGYRAALLIFRVFSDTLRQGVDEIINYDQALSNLKAITGATASEISGMDKVLREVALDTKFSLTEAATGMVLLGQAGLDASESVLAIKDTAALAAGTLSNFTTVADLVTTTLRAFGLQALETGRIADVMANAVNKSKLTMDKLRTAFNYVGATAAQAGLTIEETAATMMVLANNGMRASTIGTGLRQVLARLLSPSKKLREEFQAYGYSVEEVSLSNNTFGQSIQKLSQILWDGATHTVNMSKAFSLFGLRGAQAAAIIVKSYIGGEYQDALDKTYEVGTAMRMQAIQAQGLAFKIKNLQDAMGVFAVIIGDNGISGLFKELADNGKSLLSVIIDLTKAGVGQSILRFVVLSATAMSVAKSFQFFAFVLGKLGLFSFISRVWLSIKAIRSLSMAMGTLSAVTAVNPFGVVILGLTALYVAVDHFVSKNKEYLVSVEKATLVHRQQAQGIQAYKEMLDALEKKIQKTGEGHQQYRATLIRLANEYPELASKVDQAATSHEEFAASLSKVVLEEKTKELEGYATSVVGLDSQLQDLFTTQKILSQFDFLGVFGEHLVETNTTLAEFMETNKEAKAVSEKLQAAITSLSSGVADLAFNGQITKDQIYEYTQSVLKGKDATGELADLITTKAITAFDSMNARAKALDEIFVKDIRKMPDGFQKIFEELHAVEKIGFIKIYKEMTESLAKLTAQLKIFKDTTIISQAQMDEVLLAEKKKYLKKMQDLLDNQNGDMDRYYARQIMRVENAAARELLVINRAQFEKDVTAEEAAVKKVQLEIRTQDEILKIKKLALGSSVDLMGEELEAWKDKTLAIERLEIDLAAKKLELDEKTKDLTESRKVAKEMEDKYGSSVYRTTKASSEYVNRMEKEMRSTDLLIKKKDQLAKANIRVADSYSSGYSRGSDDSGSADNFIVDDRPYYGNPSDFYMDDPMNFPAPKINTYVPYYPEDRTQQSGVVYGNDGSILSKVKRYALGGFLPGFGGGDRRIIAAEDGEYMHRKEAVRFYGKPFMDAINSMSLRLSPSNAVRALPKFATGGPIGGSGGSVISGDTYQIVISPQIMTGDKNAVRQFAAQLEREIDRRKRSRG